MSQVKLEAGLEELARAIRRDTERGHRIVLCDGVFDVLHIGHIRHLREASECGSRLVVAIEADESVDSNAYGLPFSDAARAEVVGALDFVDYVVVSREHTIADILQRLRPHVYIGGEHHPVSKVGQRHCAVKGTEAARALGVQVGFTECVEFDAMWRSPEVGAIPSSGVQSSSMPSLARRNGRSVPLASAGRCDAQKIVDSNTLALEMEAVRKAGRRVVFTNGCFDVLHAGHVHCLQQASQMGGVLIVGLNSDSSIRSIKGPTRPINAQRLRASVLAAMSCVDLIVIFEEETPEALLQIVQPDVLVKGGTYKAIEVVGKEIVEAYGGVVCLTGIIEGVSTTAMVDAGHRRAEVGDRE